jgi:hypothetical protein
MANVQAQVHETIDDLVVARGAGDQGLRLGSHHAQALDELSVNLERG